MSCRRRSLESPLEDAYSGSMTHESTLTHEPMPGFGAADRRTFSFLALLAAGVVALVLIAVAGIIVLEPYPVLFSDASHTAALDAMVSLILHV